MLIELADDYITRNGIHAGVGPVHAKGQSAFYGAVASLENGGYLLHGALYSRQFNVSKVRRKGYTVPRLLFLPMGDQLMSSSVLTPLLLNLMTNTSPKFACQCWADSWLSLPLDRRN